MVRFALLVVLLIASRVQAAVQIVAEPMQSITKLFSPTSRPTDMPALHPQEAAVTQTNFSCALDLDYSVVEQRIENGRAVVSLKIAGAQMTLRAQTTIWLPSNAPQDLIRHEQGHETIGRLLQKQSQAVAEPIAAALEGRVLRGSGATLNEAERSLIDSAVSAACSSYLRAMSDRANRINTEFDRRTDHGRAKLDVDEAVNRAMAHEPASSTREAARR